MAEAVVASRTPPGQIATLIVPANVAWETGGQIAAIPAIPTAPIPASENIDRAAKMLQSGLRTAILLSGNALYGRGLEAAGRIAAATNAKLLVPYPFPRLERGAGRPIVDRVPYVPQQAIELLKEFRQLILVGAAEPLAYFAAPGKTAVLTPSDCEIHTLAKPEENCADALEALLSSLQSSANPWIAGKALSTNPAHGKNNSGRIGSVDRRVPSGKRNCR